MPDCNCSTSGAGTYTIKPGTSATIYKLHSTWSEQIRTITNNQVTFTVSRIGNTWAHVTMSDGTSGYVESSKIVVAPPPCTCTTNCNKTFVTKAKCVAIYREHDTSSDIKTDTSQYATLTVTKYGNTWAHVSYNDGSTTYTGYALINDIAELEQLDCTTNCNRTYITKGKDVKIYALHSTWSEPLGVIPKYATLTVIKYGSTWAYVRYSGTEGYVLKNEIEELLPCGCNTIPTGTNRRYMTKPSKAIAVYAAHSEWSLVMGQIDRGASFTVTKRGTVWAHVSYKKGNKTLNGYARVKDMVPVPPCTCTTSSNETWITKGKAVPIYHEHTETSIVDGTIHKYETFTVTKYGDVWAHVSYNDGTKLIKGYVYVSDIEKIEHVDFTPVRTQTYVAKSQAAIYSLPSQWSNSNNQIIPKGNICMVNAHDGTWHEEYYDQHGVFHEGYWENITWAHVTYYYGVNVSGYVQGDKLEIVQEYTFSEDYAGNYISKGKSTNVYKVANENSAIAGTIPKYAVFEVTSANDEWACVYHFGQDNISGFVRMCDIDKVDCICETDNPVVFETKSDNVPFYTVHSQYSNPKTYIRRKGTLLTVTEGNGILAHVEYLNMDGYVRMCDLIPGTFICECSEVDNRNYVAIGEAPVKIYPAHTTLLEPYDVDINPRTPVTVLKRSEDWAYISYTYTNGHGTDTIKGHVRTKYLDEVMTCNYCSEDYAGFYMIKNASAPTTVYEAHSEWSAKSGEIPPSAVFEVTKSNGIWAHVRYVDESDNVIEGSVRLQNIQKVPDGAEITSGSSYPGNGCEILDITGTSLYQGTQVEYRIVTISPHEDDAPATLTGKKGFEQIPATEVDSTTVSDWIRFGAQIIIYGCQFSKKEFLSIPAQFFCTASDVLEYLSELGVLLTPNSTVTETPYVINSGLISGYKKICYVWVKWKGQWFLAQRSECISGIISTTFFRNKGSNDVPDPDYETIKFKYFQGDCSYDLQKCISRVAVNYQRYPNIIDQCNFPSLIVPVTVFGEWNKLEIADDMGFPKLMTNYGVHEFNDRCPVHEFDVYGGIHD